MTVYRVARSLAAARGISPGDALAELVQQRLHATTRVDSRKAFPCFVVSEDARCITLEQTLEAEDRL